MKGCTTSHVIREMQIKTMRHHCMFIRMAKIQNTDNTKCWSKCGIGTPIHHWWEYKMEQQLWKRVWQFVTKLNILLPYNPAIMLFGIYPKEVKIRLHKKLHTGVYSSFMHNYHNLEAPRCPLAAEWINCGTVRQQNLIQC